MWTTLLWNCKLLKNPQFSALRDPKHLLLHTTGTDPPGNTDITVLLIHTRHDAAHLGPDDRERNTARGAESPVKSTLHKPLHTPAMMPSRHQTTKSKSGAHAHIAESVPHEEVVASSFSSSSSWAPRKLRSGPPSSVPPPSSFPPPPAPCTSRWRARGGTQRRGREEAEGGGVLHFGRNRRRLEPKWWCVVCGGCGGCGGCCGCCGCGVVAVVAVVAVVVVVVVVVVRTWC